MKKLCVIIGLISIAWVVQAQKVVISGTINDVHSGEPLIGVSVFDSISGTGTTTNPFGFYSITIPESTPTLRYSYIGYKTIYKSVDLSSTTMNIFLEGYAKNLREVVITAQAVDVSEEVESTQMSAIKITPDEIAKIPSLGGETDLIKVAQLMPGIARGGEGQSGMLVRGGTADQNLVILDDATVYNLGHLFGFFSVFNNEAIRDVTIYTGGFPAEFGGRLSSVMDVRMNEGSTEEFSASGGVGILSSRLTLNIPVKKHKGGITLSGRRTYIDQMFNLIGQNLPYYFYDLNMKGNYQLGPNDRIYLSGYLGDDVLSFSESDDDQTNVELNGQADSSLNFGFKLGNFTSTARWNHIYENHKLFHNFTLFQTRFKYDIEGAFLGNNILIKSQIQDFGFKADWDWSYNDQHLIKFGASVINHTFRPNIVNTRGDISDFLKNQEGDPIYTQEYGVYAKDDIKITERLSLNAGLRLSGSTTDGKLYTGLEPRVSSKFTLRPNHSVKASYSRMKQYMHRVSNSSVVLPTDLWYPVTQNIIPQSAHQIAAGYFGGIEKWKVNYSVEGYYKYMENLIEYKEGAQLLLNDNFEEELLSGNGESYGLEFMFRRKAGRITGWVAYTLAWAKRNFPGLNNGNTYFAKYDRRHTLSTVLMAELSERITFSSVWEYATGARFTAQNGQYLMPNSSFTGIETIPIYTDRNAVVMAPSHRLDINLILKGKQTRKFKGEWHLGVYNFYNRATPYRVDLEWTQFGYRYVQPGLFGLIPSVAYNFKF